MKYIVILSLVLLSSCQNNSDESDFYGDWKLIELLQDPGDGSGEFLSTDLNIMMTIKENNEVEATGVLCGYFEEPIVITGTLSLSDATISSDCTRGALSHKCSVSGSELVLSNLSCREACRAKFIRM